LSYLQSFSSAIVFFCQTSPDDTRKNDLLAAFPSNSPFQPTTDIFAPTELQAFLPGGIIERACVVEDQLPTVMSPSGNGKTTMILQEARDNGLLVNTIALHGQHNEHSICEVILSYPYLSLPLVTSN
jgi:hypothetical protein